MSQLGFTFYPKDWWASDSFYALNPFERYIYLELIFMMYVNGGFVSNNKVNAERRLHTSIKEDVWSKITDLMVKDGDQLTHRSVNSRIRKSLSNRENGRKGGRPNLESELVARNGSCIPKVPTPGQHFLYLFKRASTNTYKIGETRDLYKRRLSIKVPTSDLQIIHFVLIPPNMNLEYERQIKTLFLSNRVSGDWFSLSDNDIIRAISEMDKLGKLKKRQNYPPNNPPYKENRIEREIEDEDNNSSAAIISATYGAATLRDIEILKKECLADRVNFIEHVCRQNKINPGTIPQALSDFNSHLRSVEVFMKSKTDYRQHFQNWFKKQDRSTGKMIL